MKTRTPLPWPLMEAFEDNAPRSRWRRAMYAVGALTLLIIWPFAKAYEAINRHRHTQDR